MRGEGGDQNNYYLLKDGHGIAGGDLEGVQNPFPLYTGIAGGLHHDLSELALEQSLIFAPVWRMLIPDPDVKPRSEIFHPGSRIQGQKDSGSRIRSASKNLSILTQKNVS
jgi:hypothetical protein